MARRIDLTSRAAETLTLTHRAVLSASAMAVTLTAWMWLTRGSAHQLHSGLLMPHCDPVPAVGTFVSAVVMWQAMTIAMMTPTTLNWLFALATFTGRRKPRRVFRAVGAFAMGYFLVWLGYSIVGATAQLALQRAGFLDDGGKLPSPAAGLVLIGAGIVYCTPLSRNCLRHCRNPLTYFLGRWDNQSRGGFRFGAVHGAYCVGCCWALMLTGFAMGAMNLAWMGFLTILVTVEKLAPRGDRIAAAASAGLIVWGATLLL
jgi:predicted metal-binding membrane protein